jgi:hypothetical protein
MGAVAQMLTSLYRPMEQNAIVFRLCSEWLVSS